jgi:hypothetical protein
VAIVPAEITFVAGTVLTAAQLNSNLRDAVNFIITPPMAILRQTAAQTFGTSGTWAALLFDTEDLDRDGMHSTVTNTSRATAVTAGYYDCHGISVWAANATGGRGAALAVNGTRVAGRGAMIQACATPVTPAALTSASVYLNVGDFAEIHAVQYSGGSLNTAIGSDLAPSFTLRWVSTA